MTIDQLEKRVEQLEQTVLLMARNNVPVVNKVDDTSNRVDAITPYTETKQAYYNESEKTFYDVPNGNVSVLFDNYNGDYSVSRVVDRVTISFDVLKQETGITISVK